MFKKKSNTSTSVSSQNKILDKYSKIIGVKVSDSKLYELIDQWMGTPYKFGGKNHDGIDCSNFSCEILRANFSFPSTYYFPSSKLAEQGEIVDVTKAKEGDLVFFSINQNSKISHVGVYLANHKFVHASTSKGVVISSLDESYYKPRFAFIRRLK